MIPDPDSPRSFYLKSNINNSTYLPLDNSTEISILLLFYFYLFPSRTSLFVCFDLTFFTGKSNPDRFKLVAFKRSSLNCDDRMFSPDT